MYAAAKLQEWVCFQIVYLCLLLFFTGNWLNMASILLKVSVKEKNTSGQEVELVCKTIQFKPQVRVYFNYAKHENKGDLGKKKPIYLVFPSLGLVERLWISVVLETSLQQITNWRTDKKNFKSFMVRVIFAQNNIT